jgi:hypothetical protein
VDNSGFQLYAFHAGVPTHLASEVTYGMDINNSGLVAFSATLNGVRGIYTEVGPQIARIIGVGDNLFGSTVTQIGFGKDGLNELGQVGFFYQLANGRTGIALATPVPEPASILLAAIAILAISVVHCARQAPHCGG